MAVVLSRPRRDRARGPPRSRRRPRPGGRRRARGGAQPGRPDPHARRRAAERARQRGSRRPAAAGASTSSARSRRSARSRERALVDAALPIALPDELSAGDALSIGIAGLAGWLSLEWCAQLRAGESVLVLGASGPVGRVACRRRGCSARGRVVAAARERAALEPLRRPRCRRRSSSSTGDYAGGAPRRRGGGFDVVIDPLFGEPLVAALSATAPGARVVSLGASAGPTATIARAALARPAASSPTGTARPRPPSSAPRTSRCAGSCWPASSSPPGTSSSRSSASRRPSSARPPIRTASSCSFPRRVRSTTTADRKDPALLTDVRTEGVGSLLRPPELLEARRRHEAGDAQPRGRSSGSRIARSATRSRCRRRSASAS